MVIGGRHQRHSKSVFCVEIPVNSFRSFQSQILGQTSLKKSLFFLHNHQWVDCLDSNGACLWTLSWSRDPHCNLQILGLNNYSTNPWKVDVDPLFVGRPPLLLENLAILAVMILIISYNARFREIPFSRSPFYIAILIEKRDMFSYVFQTTAISIPMRSVRVDSPFQIHANIPISDISIGLFCFLRMFIPSGGHLQYRNICHKISNHLYTLLTVCWQVLLLAVDIQS